MTALAHALWIVVQLAGLAFAGAFLLGVLVGVVSMAGLAELVEELRRRWRLTDADRALNREADEGARLLLAERVDP